MSYVKVKILPRPHSIEFKYVGGLIFDINYVECVIVVPCIGLGWLNSKEQFHREDGPAIIWDDGEQHWCRYGHLHRENGPAAIRNSVSQFWYLNDIEYSEEEFNEEIRRRNELRKCKSLTNTL